MSMCCSTPSLPRRRARRFGDVSQLARISRRGCKIASRGDSLAFIIADFQCAVTPFELGQPLKYIETGFHCRALAPSLHEQRLVPSLPIPEVPRTGAHHPLARYQRLPVATSAVAAAWVACGCTRCAEQDGGGGPNLLSSGGGARAYCFGQPTPSACTRSAA